MNKRIILLGTLALFIISVALIAIFPPSVTNSKKELQKARQRSDLASSPIAFNLSSRGDKTAQHWNYDIQNEKKYRIRLKQQVSNQKNDAVSTELETTLVISPDGLLSFDNFGIKVFDANRELQAPSIGDMLKNISVQATFTAQAGLRHVKPTAIINPQILRVIYLLIDAFRLSMPPFPDAPIGNAASWNAQFRNGARFASTLNVSDKNIIKSAFSDSSCTGNISSEITPPPASLLYSDIDTHCQKGENTITTKIFVTAL